MNRLTRKEKVVEGLSALGVVIIMASIAIALFLGLSADPAPYLY